MVLTRKNRPRPFLQLPQPSDYITHAKNQNRKSYLHGRRVDCRMAFHDRLSSTFFLERRLCGHPLALLSGRRIESDVLLNGSIFRFTLVR